MGSPAVSVERLANDETEQAVVELMEYFGHKKIDAFMALEIGGANGLQGLALGSTKHQGCPTVDADFMGKNSLYSRHASTIQRGPLTTMLHIRSGLPNLLANYALRVSRRCFGAVRHRVR